MALITNSSYDVSRPSSPSEKRKLEIPGIILTEAPNIRPRSPPPKQIVLLNPTSLKYPPGSRSSRLFGQTARTLLLLALMVLAGWHLWVNFNVVAVVHPPPVAMQL